jgi:hypothetical protein
MRIRWLLGGLLLSGLASCSVTEVSPETFQQAVLEEVKTPEAKQKLQNLHGNDLQNFYRINSLTCNMQADGLSPNEIKQRLFLTAVPNSAAIILGEKLDTESASQLELVNTAIDVSLQQFCTDNHA